MRGILLQGTPRVAWGMIRSSSTLYVLLSVDTINGKNADIVRSEAPNSKVHEGATNAGVSVVQSCSPSAQTWMKNCAHGKGK